MSRRLFFLVLLGTGLFACKPNPEGSATRSRTPEVHVAGAMKDVMWKGELAGKIRLDTIAHRQGLYGLGPKSYLQGELLILDGQCFVSRVETDSTMAVEETFRVAAPFFVYGNVEAWEAIDLPAHIQNIGDLERYLEERTRDKTRPFAFKLSGRIREADIHIQNLPEGATVSSPAEAHQGQVAYTLGRETVDILGFFSTEHQGIFTHHDTYLHMHLISRDRTQMGHLDRVRFERMRLYLPKGKG